MQLDLSKPILCLITPGASTAATTPHSPEFQQILAQVSAAVAAGVDLIQLREKRLSARVLFELTTRAVSITRGSSTCLVVNDRADIAAGAQADGVHLTTQSIDPGIVRRTFGKDFLIGASTHSLVEVQDAKMGGADFVVFGPVFTTASKEKLGAPVGIAELRQVTESVGPFPVIALGGINAQNAPHCLEAGAKGIAGISIFLDPRRISDIAANLRQ